MNEYERQYLELSLTKLKEVLPQPGAVLMRQFETDEGTWMIEKAGENVFCLFGFSVTASMERLILLAYDEKKQIIADAGACHSDVKSFLESKEIYDYLSEDSDWMYLEHYVLSNTMFPGHPYPFCEQEQKTEEQGEVLLYTNAYVSESFRRRGIFQTMLEMMKEHALRNNTGMRKLYTNTIPIFGTIENCSQYCMFIGHSNSRVAVLLSITAYFRILSGVVGMFYHTV